ncbi:GtrA family protein [Azospirillum rugosum]|uniref:Flippase GtrA n=1 Tax=Azospirillum rugosum TaxID=416170 RepID=A0ABS4SKQ3_9PROT|nr:GtrA family protein [Azospirillum rugosum]MBP2293144.1 putative flippase GtrA [Azospirillum rugosum]MDQ0526693.1 putative flippase GtrA [Azospirillum rugosum]
MSGVLDAMLDSRLGRLACQFGKFGIVGVIGLAVDTAVVYALVFGAGLEFFAARVPAFLAAASTTFALNRAFTFRGAGDDPLHRQWAKFVAANAVGGVVNYAVSVGLESTLPVVQAHPFLAVAAGSVAGMFLNFAASKHLVFKGA